MKISNKHSLLLIQPFNLNMLIYEVSFWDWISFLVFLKCRFVQPSHVIVII